MGHPREAAVQRQWQFLPNSSLLLLHGHRLQKAHSMSTKAMT